MENQNDEFDRKFNIFDTYAEKTYLIIREVTFVLAAGYK